MASCTRVSSPGAPSTHLQHPPALACQSQQAQRLHHGLRPALICSVKSLQRGADVLLLSLGQPVGTGAWLLRRLLLLLRRLLWLLLLLLRWLVRTLLMAHNLPRCCPRPRCLHSCGFCMLRLRLLLPAAAWALGRRGACLIGLVQLLILLVVPLLCIIRPPAPVPLSDCSRGASLQAGCCRCGCRCCWHRRHCRCWCR